MNEKVYVCTGGCGAVISQERYNQGLTKCGTKGCSHHGYPFEKRLKCTICSQIFKESDNHQHQKK